jgi:hypothetical protein
MLRIVSAITENERRSFSVIAERGHQNWVATFCARLIGAEVEYV